MSEEQQYRLVDAIPQQMLGIKNTLNFQDGWHVYSYDEQSCSENIKINNNDDDEEEYNEKIRQQPHMNIPMPLMLVLLTVSTLWSSNKQNVRQVYTDHRRSRSVLSPVYQRLCQYTDFLEMSKVCVLNNEDNNNRKQETRRRATTCNGCGQHRYDPTTMSLNRPFVSFLEDTISSFTNALFVHVLLCASRKFTTTTTTTKDNGVDKPYYQKMEQKMIDYGLVARCVWQNKSLSAAALVHYMTMIVMQTYKPYGDLSIDKQICSEYMVTPPDAMNIYHACVEPALLEHRFYTSQQPQKVTMIHPAALFVLTFNHMRRSITISSDYTEITRAFENLSVVSASTLSKSSSSNSYLSAFSDDTAFSVQHMEETASTMRRDMIRLGIKLISTCKTLSVMDKTEKMDIKSVFLGLYNVCHGLEPCDFTCELVDFLASVLNNKNIGGSGGCSSSSSSFSGQYVWWRGLLSRDKDFVRYFV